MIAKRMPNKIYAVESTIAIKSFLKVNSSKLGKFVAENLEVEFSSLNTFLIICSNFSSESKFAI